VRSEISHFGRTELGWLEPPHVLVLPASNTLQSSCHISHPVLPREILHRPRAPGAEPTHSTPAWHAMMRTTHLAGGGERSGEVLVCGWYLGRRPQIGEMGTTFLREIKKRSRVVGTPWAGRTSPSTLDKCSSFSASFMPNILNSIKQLTSKEIPACLQESIVLLSVNPAFHSFLFLHALNYLQLAVYMIIKAKDLSSPRAGRGLAGIRRCAMILPVVAAVSSVWRLPPQGQDFHNLWKICGLVYLPSRSHVCIPLAPPSETTPAGA
jgi:hypothetical protein